MSAVTHLTQLSTSVNSTFYSTVSFTPTAGDFLVAFVTMSGGTGTNTACKATSTSTALTVTYLGTPVSGSTYLFSVLVIG